MLAHSEAIQRTLVEARKRLLLSRVSQGHWEGELSSSALSTATAVCALEVFRRSCSMPCGKEGAELASLVGNGIRWLCEHQSDDGGWGDTVDSPSNVSTTVLCWSAINVLEEPSECVKIAEERAEAWIRDQAGGLTPTHLASAIDRAYGEDKTFSVPILTMCAICGRLGRGRAAWRLVRALPFELAALPHQWFRWLGLSVVSYALPALVAIGQVRHHHRPTRNPLTRFARHITREKTLRVLRSIQPASGGFLEAAPLTSFVLMSLAFVGRGDDPVARDAAAFLIASVRPDGSWPIDTNLATWVTTLTVNALALGDALRASLSREERSALQHWLLEQQYKTEHPYTHAAPGGWAWTDRSGGVPDADDTAGALLALRNLTRDGDNVCAADEQTISAATAGVRWLLDLQNKDGGIPTFCRGWGRLPFDRSSPDLAAHTIRAWTAWEPDLSDELRRRIPKAMRKALRYLTEAQNNDGTWVPLWFGNQATPGQRNPLYGTTRVLRADDVPSIGGALEKSWRRARQRGVRWMLSAQNRDGGWGGGGDASVPSTIEETAMAVEALAFVLRRQAAGGADADRGESPKAVLGAIDRGCGWLVEHTDGGTVFESAPIGLYFAKLWYAERLYPIIFTASALEYVRQLEIHEAPLPSLSADSV